MVINDLIIFGLNCLFLRFLLQLGEKAASLSVAELYVNAFGNLAKTNNTVVLPANVGDAASMVAQVIMTLKEPVHFQQCFFHC